jgi:hypothetical protein
MRRLLVGIFLMIIVPVRWFAQVGFITLLPNPRWDDTLGEYIELRNRGCITIDISGYRISDLSGKSYGIPEGMMISSHETRRWLYSETKIALNNSSEEAVYLKDRTGTLIDEYHYSGTQRDDVILEIGGTDEECPVVAPDDPPSTATWAVAYTGEIADTGSTLEAPYSTGALSDTWWILESTGSITGTGWPDIELIGSIDTGSTYTGSTDTGTLTPSTWWAPPSSTGSNSAMTEAPVETYIETGALTPISLVYDDQDGDHLIDTLEILYPYELTGSIDLSLIMLFSRTWWLSTTKIDTATWHILSGSLRGNLLILTLLEWDIEKDILHITNSTSSDLRLKSSGDLGFRSRWGQIPTAFFLTSSFDMYRAVVPKHPVLVSVSDTESIDGYSSSWGTWEIQFPDIVLTLQSPTNATLSGEVFTCTTYDCRINLTLEPIFSSGYAMKDYVCLFGTGWVRVIDIDCNPNTIYYTHSWVLDIELQSKNQSGVKIEKSYQIDMRVISSGSPSIPQGRDAPDITTPHAILEHDAKWKDYYEQIGDYEMNCHTYTCSLNFTAERSYDPDGGEVRFLWIYDYTSVSTSRDPGVRKLSLWDHVVILRVIDGAGNYDEIRYIVHVLWPKPKTEKISIQKEKKKPTQKSSPTIQVSLDPEKKSWKKIRMMFFSQPDIELQWKTGKPLESGDYLCEYKRAKHCSINFTLTGTTTGARYVWYLDGVEIHIGKNPKSWKLSPGKHDVNIRWYRKWASTAEYEKHFRVVVSQAPKAPKKQKPKSTKNTPLLTIIPDVRADDGGFGTPRSSSESLLVLLAVFGAGYVVMYLSRMRSRRAGK